MARRPNILLIMADQLSAAAVGAYQPVEKVDDTEVVPPGMATIARFANGGTGSVRSVLPSSTGGHGRGSRTPQLDALARRGVVWETAYTPAPMCMPARAALWTGMLPQDTGVFSNGGGRIPAGMPTLGGPFRQAGYRCVHVGKGHDCGGLREFEVCATGASPVEETPPWINYYDTTEDRCTAGQAVAFLAEPGDAPYLLVADFNNPHDICLWIGEHAGPHADTPVPGHLPPLPANFDTPDMSSRPRAVRENAQFNFRVAETAGWTPDNFRHYLAAYEHYIDMLERDVTRVLTALARRADAENTIVVFTADHGDGMAAHRMVTKGAHFYEETARVPLIFAGPGVQSGGAKIGGTLASLVDLFPTLCDLAGVAAPAGLRGRSLAPWLRGPAPAQDGRGVTSAWREGNDQGPAGRMLRTRRFKYTVFDEDGGEELYDLEQDPGEQRSLVGDPRWRETLEEHRALLKQHGAETGDPFFQA